MKRHRLLWGHHRSGPGPEAGHPAEETKVASPTPMDVKVVEAALAVAPLALPTIADNEEMQVAGLPMFAVSVEAVVVEVAKEEKLTMASPLTIEAVVEVLPVVANVLRGETIGEARGTIMADLPAIQAVVKVLSIAIELLVVEC